MQWDLLEQWNQSKFGPSMQSFMNSKKRSLVTEGSERMHSIFSRKRKSLIISPKKSVIKPNILNFKKTELS